MEKYPVMHGIRMVNGDFEIEIEATKKMIKERCIDRGMNFVDFTFTMDDIPAEYFTELAEFLKDNGIYFVFHYQNTRRNAKSGTVRAACGYEKETALEMKKIAGKYFVGHELGELGADFCAFGSDYTRTWKVNWSENFGRDLKEAWNRVSEHCSKEIEVASMDGEIPVTVIESTGMVDPIAQCGQSFIVFEGFNGNPDIMTAMGRGASKRMPMDVWGSYIAHEWYAGVRCQDTLKMHRLELMYKYLYLSGANYFMIESGDYDLHAHDVPREEKEVDGKMVSVPIWDENCEICREYRKVMDEFADFMNSDNRPVGGPKVKVAFIQGNYDGYSPWRAGSSIYNVFGNPDFSWSKPEFMWRIFDDVYQKREWHDIHNFGDADLSGAPAYGAFDIISASAGNEIFSQYDYIIFTGWNTMTGEIYEELKKFVHGGGRLFMTAAHLNTSVKRDGEMKLINGGDVSDLFGCKLSAEEAFSSNAGWKHVDSIVPELMYPHINLYDPIFSEGHLRYAKAELTTGVSAAGLSSRFSEKDFIGDNEPGLIENKYGDGYAILMPCLEYPSANGWGEYKNVVREILTASARGATVKVLAPSKVRFSVYEGDKVYLLNTDVDCGAKVTIDYGTEKREIVLEPKELRAVER